jgi:hypothetical protein
MTAFPQRGRSVLLGCFCAELWAELGDVGVDLHCAYSAHHQCPRLHLGGRHSRSKAWALSGSTVPEMESIGISWTPSRRLWAVDAQPEPSSRQSSGPSATPRRDRPRLAAARRRSRISWAKRRSASSNPQGLKPITRSRTSSSAARPRMTAACPTMTAATTRAATRTKKAGPGRRPAAQIVRP